MEMEERLEQILDKEKYDSNSNYIYLYKMNGNWFAYERSAFYLFSIHRSDAIFKITNPKGKNVILVAVLKQQIKEARHSHIKVIERTENNMVLDCRITCKGFLHWKEGLLPLCDDFYSVAAINEFYQSVL